MDPIAGAVDNIFYTLGIFGFLLIGPSFYLIQKSTIDKSFKLKGSQVLHLIPIIVLTLLWLSFDQIRNSRYIWRIFYQSILLHYMIYISISIYKVFREKKLLSAVKKQLNIYGMILLVVWFAFLLDEVARAPYVAASVLYISMLAFSIIILSKGAYLIDHRTTKYKKTGLSGTESDRIRKALSRLINEEKIYQDNLISLPRLAKKLNASTHAVSQVINEQYQQSFFELISNKRIGAAKTYLKENPKMKISDIAFSVGYNSLSAFNTAFKKQIGLTPGKYKNEQ